MKEKRKTINQKIIDFYGIKEQSIVAMEECSELIQAISKCIRYPDAKKYKGDLAEEIADVCIVIEQLKIMYGVDDKTIKNIKLEKKHRQLERIGNLTNEKN